MNRRAWYAGLRKPGWKPPDRMVPLVWAALYPMILLAGWLVWTREGWGVATVLWVAQMALNLAWPLVFLGLMNLAAAFMLAVALWLAVLACVLAFLAASGWAAALMLPYLLWVGFAVALSWSLHRLNV